MFSQLDQEGVQPFNLLVAGEHQHHSFSKISDVQSNILDDLLTGRVHAGLIVVVDDGTDHGKQAFKSEIGLVIGEKRIAIGAVESQFFLNQHLQCIPKLCILEQALGANLDRAGLRVEENLMKVPAQCNISEQYQISKMRSNIFNA